MNGRGGSSSCPSPVALEEHAAGGETAGDVAVHLEACATCRARVEEIRRHNELMGDLIAARAAPEGSSSRLAGAIPGYEIEAEIHRGGQGAVFRARQLATQRPVAVKVLLAGAFATRRQRHRFEREIELVANLSHPNIVVVHDSGVTADGRHYFAMELVDGVALTTYADDARLGPRERLRLMAIVARAVHYAHQRGVIHRDLKPANILVTGAGEPKILDFGVARITDSDLRRATLQTEVGQLVGTVPYMSPEQVMGDPQAIDVRSDVYALGVVTYELLTGRLPHELGGHALPDAVRIIRDEEPTPLSSVDRVYRGDVDTMIGKALEKEPGRRYESAAAFADDLERYLADQPITAHPPSRSYQLRKFARRNRAIVVGTAAAFLALLVGLVGTTIFALDATRARDRAETALGQSDAIVEFLVGMLRDVQPGEEGRDLLVLDVLARAAEDADRELADEPLIEARVREAIGISYLVLGEAPRAEENLLRALALRRAVQGPEHWETAVTMSDVAAAYRNVSRYEEAEDLYRRAIEIQGRELGPLDERTLGTRGQLGFLVFLRGRREEAARELTAVVDAWRSLDRLDHSEAMMAMTYLATVHQTAGRNDEAEAILAQAVEVLRRTRGPEDPDTLDAQFNLAVTVVGAGRSEEGELLMREVLAVQRRVLPPHKPQTYYTMIHVADLAERHGRPEEAEALLTEAGDALVHIMGPTHPQAHLARRRLADHYVREGRDAEAEATYRVVLAAMRDNPGPDHRTTISTSGRLASFYASRHRYADAALTLERAVAAAERGLGRDHSEAMRQTERYAIVLNALGRHGEAAATYRALLETIEARRPSPVRSRRRVRVGLATTLSLAGNDEGALERYDALLATTGDPAPAPGRDMLVARHNRAMHHLVFGRATEAVSASMRVLAEADGAVEAGAWDRGAFVGGLGLGLLAQGRTDAALTALDEAVERLDEALGAEHPRARAMREHRDAARTGRPPSLAPGSVGPFELFIVDVRSDESGL